MSQENIRRRNAQRVLDALYEACKPSTEEGGLPIHYPCHLKALMTRRHVEHMPVFDRSDNEQQVYLDAIEERFESSEYWFQRGIADEEEIARSRLPDRYALTADAVEASMEAGPAPAPSVDYEPAAKRPRN